MPNGVPQVPQLPQVAFPTDLSPEGIRRAVVQTAQSMARAEQSVVEALVAPLRQAGLAVPELPTPSSLLASLAESAPVLPSAPLPVGTVQPLQPVVPTVSPSTVEPRPAAQDAGGTRVVFE